MKKKQRKKKVRISSGNSDTYDTSQNRFWSATNDVYASWAFSGKRKNSTTELNHFLLKSYSTEINEFNEMAVEMQKQILMPEKFHLTNNGICTQLSELICFVGLRSTPYRVSGLP